VFRELATVVKGERCGAESTMSSQIVVGVLTCVVGGDARGTARNELSSGYTDGVTTTFPFMKGRK
jgi:hypothetical protein